MKSDKRAPADIAKLMAKELLEDHFRRTLDMRLSDEEFNAAVKDLAKQIRSYRKASKDLGARGKK